MVMYAINLVPQFSTLVASMCAHLLPTHWLECIPVISNYLPVEVMVVRLELDKLMH